MSSSIYCQLILEKEPNWSYDVEYVVGLNGPINQYQSYDCSLDDVVATIGPIPDDKSQSHSHSVGAKVDPETCIESISKGWIMCIVVEGEVQEVELVFERRIVGYKLMSYIG